MATTASFGGWVRRRRRGLDLTQAQLAALASCTESLIRKIEADERRPSRELAGRLAEALTIAPDERPRFVAPFHPRLDWQFWFAALAPVQSLGWLETLAVRLRSNTPEVLGLLGRNPFPDAPPRHVRAVLYDYRFSTREERRRSGAWWVRERQGELPLGE